MTVRIGELMVKRGLLTEDQVGAILREQRERGGAFGDIAERIYDLDPNDVEMVWAEQYAAITRAVNAEDEKVDPGAIATVNRRQAWQFRVLPLRFDGDELVMCTTPEHLTRALRFVYRGLQRPSYFVLADAESLGRALARHYPMAGLDGRHVPGGNAETMEAMAFRVGRR